MKIDCWRSSPDLPHFIRGFLSTENATRSADFPPHGSFPFGTTESFANQRVARENPPSYPDNPGPVRGFAVTVEISLVRNVNRASLCHISEIAPSPQVNVDADLLDASVGEAHLHDLVVRAVGFVVE